MANDALEKIRKATRENLTTKQTRALMNDRFVLLKRHRDLTDEEYLKLSGWTRNYPLLGEGYEMKEAFYDIWNCASQAEAEKAYHVWLEQITPEIKPYFSDLIRAVGNWHNEIFCYFDNRVTNAYTESLNNLIKVLHKVGRGYSFDVLRAKILYSEGLHKTKRPKFDKRRKAGTEFFMMYATSKSPAPKKTYSGASISTLTQKLAAGEI